MLQNKLRSAGKTVTAVGMENYIPSLASPAFWEGLPVSTSEAFIRRGRLALAEEIPPLPATLYMDFFRTGNRSRFEIPFFQRRTQLLRLVLAYCAGDRSTELLDGIINLLSAVCDEWTWVLPAHNWPLDNPLPPGEPPRVDLMAANTASLVALAVHLLSDHLEKAAGRLKERALRECRRRCIRPYMENDDHWWMGYLPSGGHGKLNNWTPWITDNFLHTLFLIHETPEELVNGVERGTEILNHYLDILPQDGGCDEGPTYWEHAVGSLYGCLDILEFLTEGRLDLLKDPFLVRAEVYLKHVHIGGDYYANFADCPGRLKHPPAGLLRRMAQSSGSRELEELALSLGSIMEAGSVEWSVEEAFSSHRTIRDLTIPLPSEKQKFHPEADDVRIFPETQIYIKRSDELFFACKGGHNGESHNHNDAGQFILYYGEHPFLIDPGVGDYTRETFSSSRYSIWTMQSLWHNLPVVNGFGQKEGAEYRCSSFQGNRESCSIEMGGTYPAGAGVDLWKREFRFTDGVTGLVLTDSWKCRSNGNTLQWNFISLETPEAGGGRISIASKCGRLDLFYPGELFDVLTEERRIPEDDFKMSSWGTGSIWRISLNCIKPFPAEGTIEFKFNFSQ